MSSNHEALIPVHFGSPHSLVIVSAFTAALCWWVGIAAVVSSGGGALVFLTPPVLASAATMWAVRRGRRRAARHVGTAAALAAGRPISAARQSLVALGAFTAALCWWVGIVGVAHTGGGAAVFLAIPALVSLGTVLAFRDRRRPSGR